ncbi:hypothetical protein MJG53_016763 [Ovis ammon polii x Ovis aries]|uniref:Uncharacterized protein n=1 Tax=Ovis ammon polii x Ovis aries TaxID=2918886 RepID=A0ACB9U9U0_9CETA|nr:hypothetical protein MJG53_016763 [Ovis ammon polii x Ovis aries]
MTTEAAKESLVRICSRGLLSNGSRTRCTIDDRVTRVAWLNRSTILYAGNDKWSIDPRVIILVNTPTQYSIMIQNVDVYDEGPYTCSVQTDNHPKTSRVHLIVQALNTFHASDTGLLGPPPKEPWVVFTGFVQAAVPPPIAVGIPPQIMNISSDVTVNEGSSVTLLCLAIGRPEPTVTWRHLSVKEGQGFVSEDEYLEISDIKRDQSGEYECSALNDVAAPDVRKVKITVNYPPYISKAKNTGVSVGQKGILSCEASAVPMAEFQWFKEDTRLATGLDGMRIENKGHMSTLTFFNVSEKDYGNYTCVATNKLGITNASITLYGSCQEPDLQNMNDVPKAVCGFQVPGTISFWFPSTYHSAWCTENLSNWLRPAPQTPDPAPPSSTQGSIILASQQQEAHHKDRDVHTGAGNTQLPPPHPDRHISKQHHRNQFGFFDEDKTMEENH